MTLSVAQNDVNILKWLIHSCFSHIISISEKASVILRYRPFRSNETFDENEWMRKMDDVKANQQRQSHDHASAQGHLQKFAVAFCVPMRQPKVETIHDHESE